MSAAMAAAAAAAQESRRSYSASKRSSSSSNNSMTGNTYYGGTTNQQYLFARPAPRTSSRYETQKQTDWKTFDQYRKNHKPVPIALPKCSSEHVLDFLRYLEDQVGETKQYNWGSLDALVGRLRVAFEENGGRPETNPFASPDVKLYLRQVKGSQVKGRER